MKTIKEILGAHISWRKQIFKLAKADIIKTYSGAALGWAWALIKPTITIFVYWFAFSIGLRVGRDVNGIPYALWLIAGVIPWFYMSEVEVPGSYNSYICINFKICCTFVSDAAGNHYICCLRILSGYLYHTAALLYAVYVFIFYCMGTILFHAFGNE